jgi:hypothetical protein
MFRTLWALTKGHAVRPTPSRPETWLLAATAALLLLALLGPAIAQPAAYHQFADRRAFWGLPFAMDVLSNLPFAIAGLAGMGYLRRLPHGAIGNIERAMAWLFFAGLLLTAAASSWYHFAPDDAGLAIDRAGMAVAFAGLLGLAAAIQISERAGAALGLALLVLAPLASWHCSLTGNVLPWAVAQCGGGALLLAMALLRPHPGALCIRWGLVIVAYAAAKAFELLDADIFALTGQLVSGHTLKHLVAALAAVPVLVALGGLGNWRQNRPRPPATMTTASPGPLGE